MFFAHTLEAIVNIVSLFITMKVNNSLIKKCENPTISLNINNDLQMQKMNSD